MSTKFNILDIIGSHNIYEIDYCKPNGEMRTRHIMDACFSEKYGNNYIDWNIGIKCAIGGAIGGIIGAKLLKKLPEKILKEIFILFLLYVSVKMII